MPGQKGTYVDPEEKKITDREKMLKIPTPADFKSQASRDALYRLNKRKAEEAGSKNDTPEDMAKKQRKFNVANPVLYKKGGKVKRGGIALVHKGERVLTKAQAKKYGKRKVGEGKFR